MEVYGEKPKLFSEKWWENFFYYYKVHTIVAIFVLLTAGYLIYSDVTAVKYDLSIDYISEFGILSEQTDKIAEVAEGQIDDATGNGECDAFVLMLDMKPTQDVQFAQAMQVKFMAEQAYSDAFVFIMTKQYADMMCGNGLFENVSVWSGTDEDAECISLAGCTAFDGSYIPVDDLYVAVRKLRDKEEKDERKIIEHQNGMKFAKFLIDER